MNLKRSSGREQLFWSISKWGADFPERIKSITIGKDARGQPLEIDQRLEEVTIGESWKRVSRCLLHRLVEMHPGDGFLPDMTPVINLIILSGKQFQMNEKHFSENLFNIFTKQIGNVSCKKCVKIFVRFYNSVELDRDKSHLHGNCPYNGESTIDVLIR